MKKKLLYEDWFVRQELDKENSIYFTTFLETSFDVYAEVNDWKNYFLRLVDFLEHERPKYMISNHHKRTMVIPVEVQSWVAQEIAPRMIKVGLQKYAQVLSTEFISQLSGKQLVNDSVEVHGHVFETQLFDNESDAMKWILE